MKRQKNLGRARRQRPENRRFLIYCEDEYASRHYIEALKRRLHSIPITVKVASGRGEPLDLVREAATHQARAPHCSEDRYTAYDEVWCVLDVEAPHPHPALPAALKSAKECGLRVALANPCFEL
ncbi:RloB-like protein [Stackebrandtia albiflava]|uniref:RloB-like protein n=1 Tax=Stackebrandtia albiflava TaxID=406432 RepID=A0A562V2I9_9ACTN|nr:RloB family protein [Stackebrandtia albiflava]TWJ12027.1 RloB-like protein [Stackebrandtia albiflava]